MSETQNLTDRYRQEESQFNPEAAHRGNIRVQRHAEKPAGSSWEPGRAAPPGGSERMCNTDPTAYPLRTPRTRLRTKNEPRMIRLTKYTQGHSHPIASFTCKM